MALGHDHVTQLSGRSKQTRMSLYKSARFEDTSKTETSPRWASLAWPVWLIAAIVAVIPRFQFHLDIFRAIDFRLYVFLWVALATAGVAAAIYIRLRVRVLWRHEPAILLGIVALFGLVYAPLAAVVVAWIAAVAFACGARTLRALDLDPEPAPAGLCGLGLLSCGMFALGLLHGYRTGILFAVMAALTVALRRSLWDQMIAVRRMGRGWADAPELKSSSVGLAVFSSAILVTFACVAWLTPTWFGDSVRFHLPLVLSYLKSHSIAVPDLIPYGYYPQGFEVLATLGYALGGQVAAQGIEPLFFLIAVALLIQIARACGTSRKWAIVGAALGASTPFLHWTGVVFKNDISMSAFQLGALLCFFRWRESHNFRSILLGTFFVAMSFEIKYVALMGAVPLGILYAFALVRTRHRIRWGIAAVAVFACAGLMWPLRTYVVKGSMTFPQQASRAVTVASLQAKTGPAISSHVWLPYRVFSEGKRYFESGSNTPLGIGLLLVAPLWFLKVREPSAQRAERVVWLFVGLYYVYWALVGIVLRYAITPVLLLSVLGAAQLDRMRPWSANLCLGATFIFSIPVLAIMELAPAHVPFFAKTIDASEFLTRSLPPYAAVHFLQGHVPSGARIASLGDWAAAYAPDPSRFDVTYRTTRLYTADDVKKLLANTNADVLILPNSRNLEEWEAAARIYRNLARIHTDADFVVYRLSDLNPPH